MPRCHRNLEEAFSFHVFLNQLVTAQSLVQKCMIPGIAAVIVLTSSTEIKFTFTFPRPRLAYRSKRLYHVLSQCSKVGRPHLRITGPSWRPIGLEFWSQAQVLGQNPASSLSKNPRRWFSIPGKNCKAHKDWKWQVQQNHLTKSEWIWFPTVQPFSLHFWDPVSRLFLAKNRRKHHLYPGQLLRPEGPFLLATLASQALLG